MAIGLHVVDVTLCGSCMQEDCDYLTFYKSGSPQEYWGKRHYWGHAFPGVGTRPPLVIPAPSFELHFRTDSSGVDWGYRLVVTASVPVPHEVAQPHWLSDLTFSAWYVSGLAAMNQFQGPPPCEEEVLDVAKGSWLESDLFSRGRLSPSACQKFSGLSLVGSVPPEEEEDFLRDLIVNRDGSEGSKLAALMRVYLGAEDFGTDAMVNSTVRAVAAAAIHLSGLSPSCVHFATSSKLVSAAFVSRFLL